MQLHHQLRSSHHICPSRIQQHVNVSYLKCLPQVDNVNGHISLNQNKLGHANHSQYTLNLFPIVYKTVLKVS